MAKRAREGTCLATWVKMALPMFRQAELQSPRRGPGRKPRLPEWLIAVLIMIAVLKRKKSKSAQYRSLCEHRTEIAEWVGTEDFPSRSTYFQRYRRAHRLYQEAIRLQGQKAVEDGLADPTTVAVDKSLVSAQGPPWHKKDRQAGRIPKGLHGVDPESTWGYSEHHGWVQGYSYEVVVTATANGTVWPLLASAELASASEHVTFGEKIEHLGSQVLYVLATAATTTTSTGNGSSGTRREIARASVFSARRTRLARSKAAAGQSSDRLRKPPASNGNDANNAGRFSKAAVGRSSTPGVARRSNRSTTG